MLLAYLIEGTYRPLGNDGDHYNQAINAGNNYYFPGDTQRGNSLADALIIASDHLPLIADYQVPAILGWDWNQEANRVLVDADTSVDFMIQNDAPVFFSEGADLLRTKEQPVDAMQPTAISTLIFALIFSPLCRE